MEDIYELMKSPLSTLVCMLFGFPLFTLGVSWMGIFVTKALSSNYSFTEHIFMATGVTIIGLTSLSLGFMGLAEMIIEKELAEKGYY